MFWSDGSLDAMQDALAYIKRFNLDRDDVSLRRNENETIITAKRDISEKLKRDRSKMEGFE